MESSRAVGVDLGGTNLRACLVDASGVVLRSLERATPPAPPGAFDGVAALVDALDPERRAPACIGVAGLVWAGELRAAPSLPGFAGARVRVELERRLGRPVRVENDGLCAMVGEAWVGAARGEADALLVTLGTGVGGGLLLGGAPVRGARGAAAELGHVVSVPGGLPCPCGARGCLEQYASAAALVRAAREVPALVAALEAGAEGLGAARIAALARAGSAEAGALFARAGDALGSALAGLSHVLDVPLFVVGGGLSRAWDLLEPSARAALLGGSFVARALGAPRLVAAREPSLAGAIGAARLALEAGP